MSLSHLEEAIATLLRGKELTDQHILQALREAGVSCEPAMVYTTLRRLERKGLILIHIDRRPGQIEHRYELAPLGQRVLDRLQSTRLVLSRWYPPAP